MRLNRDAKDASSPDGSVYQRELPSETPSQSLWRISMQMGATSDQEVLAQA